MHGKPNTSLKTDIIAKNFCYYIFKVDFNSVFGCFSSEPFNKAMSGKTLKSFVSKPKPSIESIKPTDVYLIAGNSMPSLNLESTWIILDSNIGDKVFTPNLLFIFAI